MNQPEKASKEPTAVAVLRNSNKEFTDSLIRTSRRFKINFKDQKPSIRMFNLFFSRDPDCVQLYEPSKRSSEVARTIVRYWYGTFFCIGIGSFFFTFYNMRRRWFYLTRQNSKFKNLVKYFVLPAVLATIVTTFASPINKYDLIQEEISEQLKDPYYQQRIAEYREFLDNQSPQSVPMQNHKEINIGGHRS